jgi:hypothetical protein
MTKMALTITDNEDGVDCSVSSDGHIDEANMTQAEELMFAVMDFLEMQVEDEYSKPTMH